MDIERRKVSCKIPNYKDPLRRIKVIGGEDTDTGESSRMCLNEAIRRIEEGSLSLYTEADGITAEITVGTREETKFLKTLPDETDLNNILKIGFCFEILC